MSKGYKSILVLSDMHFPYNHADIVAFLKALKKKYKPDKVISVGDELDYHSASFHDSDPDLHSAGKELETAIKRLQPIYKLFPNMDLVESNHGSMMFRKALAHGLPRKAMNTYQATMEAPKGWRWHDKLVVRMSNGQDVYIVHGLTKDALKNSKSVAMNFVQGHWHSTFEIRYWANPNNLFWGMTVGCLIERSSLAFAYGKYNLDKPIIGCAVILNGQPRLEPMLLDSKGRWIGKLSGD